MPNLPNNTHNNLYLNNTSHVCYITNTVAPEKSRTLGRGVDLRPEISGMGEAEEKKS